jgi:hypothetical protein
MPPSHVTTSQDSSQLIKNLTNLTNPESDRLGTHQKVKQRPKLKQLVLHRRSSEKQLMLHLVALECRIELAGIILDPVALVQNEVMPLLI